MGSRARARRRGSSSVEAVIILPFMVLVLAGIVFVGKAGSRKQRLLSESRACAWQYALAGCVERADLPPTCTPSMDPNPESAGATVTRAGEDRGALDELAALPAIGGLFDSLVGHSISAGLTDRTPRPLLLGGGTLELRASTRVLCNERPHHGDMLSNLWHAFGLDL